MLRNPRSYASQQPAQRAEIRCRWHGQLGLAEYRFDGSQVLPDHGHPWASVNWLLGGGLTERIGRRTEELAAGAAIFRPAGTNHAVRVGPGGGRALHLEIGPAWTQRLRDAGSLDSVVERQRGPLHRLAARLHAELVVWDEWSPHVVEGLTLELLGHVGRRRAGQAKGRSRPGWLDRAIERLRYSDRRLTADDLATDLDLDAVYLARTFRRWTGESLGAYGLKARLFRAHQRVLCSSDSIADIAHALGFSDHAHLTRRFKRQFGVPPSALRRAARG